MLSYKRFWIVWIVVYVLDLITKSWIVTRAHELRYEPIILIDGISGVDAFLEITYVTNPGAAWSMLSDYPEFLTILSFVALLGIFTFRKSLEIVSLPQQYIFGLIDVFLPIINYDYPIFNVADSGIFLGATSYFIWSILDSRKKETEGSVGTT